MPFWFKSHSPQESVALLVLSQYRSVGSTAIPQSVISKEQGSPKSTPRDGSIHKKGQQSISVLSQATEHMQTMNWYWENTGKKHV